MRKITLLQQTKVNLQEKSSCEREIPRYSSFNNLTKYCTVMKDHIDQEEISGRKYYPGEISKKSCHS